MTDAPEVHLWVDVVEAAPTPRITVRGELDVASADQLASALAGLAPSAAGVDIDLSQVSFIDSSGLRVITATMRDGDEHGGAVRVVAASDAVRRIIELTGLGEVLALPE